MKKLIFVVWGFSLFFSVAAQKNVSADTLKKWHRMATKFTRMEIIQRH